MNGFDVKMAGPTPEFYMYGDIGGDFDGVTSEQFAKALESVRKSPELNIRVNSQGGDVFEAYAMFGALKRFPGRVTMHVDGLAASAASYLIMAGHRIKMADNAMVMIHEPYSIAKGTASQLEGKVAMLRKITGTVVETYAKRTGQNADDVMAMMAAETWMDAEESLAKGFADEIVGGLKVAARVDAGRFAKAPVRLLVTDGQAISEYRKRLAAFQPKER
jgi:ATP-dependent Clp protease protease subunit